MAARQGEQGKGHQSGCKSEHSPLVNRQQISSPSLRGRSRKLGEREKKSLLPTNQTKKMLLTLAPREKVFCSHREAPKSPLKSGGGRRRRRGKQNKHFWAKGCQSLFPLILPPDFFFSRHQSRRERERRATSERASGERERKEGGRKRKGKEKEEASLL